MRKEAARQAAEELRQQEENRKDLIFVSSIVGGLLFGMAAIGVLLILRV
jgi:hypothetical protein